MTDPKRVVLGQIRGAHGIRGEVAIRTFTADPADIASYGPLAAGDTGRSLEITPVRTTEGGVIARIAGIGDRTAAEALKGVELWVPRDRLPEPDQEEFYHADLIGLRAETADGRLIGTIVAVQNFGAGDLIEIALEGSRRTELVPFASQFVPEVDLPGRRIVVEIAVAVEAEEDGEQKQSARTPPAERSNRKPPKKPR